MEQLISNEKIPTPRKSTEYNGMELVCPVVLLNRNKINNYDELDTILSNMIKDKLYEDKIKFNNEKDLLEYIKDIREKKKLTNNYIKNFNKQLELSGYFPPPEDIKTIYISGKTNKHSEIDKLNEGLSKLEAKGDVYIEQKNGKCDGLSVKQSKAATKSNYSVQKILGKETDKLLTEIKKNYLTEQGFPPKFNELDRDELNKLFKPENKENPYMSKLKEEIEKNKQMICNFLIEKLYCSNVKYDIYEFDGLQLNKLIKPNDNSDITFGEYMPYYYKKSGEKRDATKLFYRLTCRDKIYRVEVRWKGNLYVSPQFQIHEE